MEFCKEVYMGVLVCVVLVNISGVSAIKCFQCSSMDAGCLELESNSTSSKYYKECNLKDKNVEPFCRKTTQTIMDMEYVRVTRECGWILHKQRNPNCYLNDDDFKLERSCQCFSDGCNKAETLQHLDSILISCVILLITYFKML